MGGKNGVGSDTTRTRIPEYAPISIYIVTCPGIRDKELVDYDLDEVVLLDDSFTVTLTTTTSTLAYLLRDDAT
jgi:hypothetical protein